METPICDFVQRYAAEQPLRLHMPGHKGQGALGVEAWDITEIDGADVLYSAAGIIARSEAAAASLFGAARTWYSTEGSSLCIRAMVYLAALMARERGETPRIWAARNAHRVFVTAAALLDVEVDWLYPSAAEGLLSCTVTADALEQRLTAQPHLPTAVYITSPDYLGQRADVAGLAAVCHRHGVLLFVDNAHGAYLRFLPQSLHPLQQGADLCCDSAHKTLPVLTGGAYLHLSATAPAALAAAGERALALFASTSPSYLILQSLDAANRTLATEYPAQLAAFAVAEQACRARLEAAGFVFVGDEPLKWTVLATAWGYTGHDMAARLQQRHIHCEMADPDHVVLMWTPALGDAALAQVEQALLSIPPCAPLRHEVPPMPRAVRVLSLREALLATQEEVPVTACVGRIMGDPAVSCPPAVPILVCGERVDADAVRCMQYYGFTTCRVVRE